MNNQKFRVSNFHTAALAILIPMLAYAQTTRIVHIPVKIGTVGQSIQVDARVEGTNQPETAVLFYRSPDQTAFKMSEMEVDQWRLRSEITAIDVTERGVEYYLEVKLTNGEILTSPDGAPNSNPANKINIKPISVADQSVVGDAAVMILSPSPGAKMTGGEVLVALALNQTARKMPVGNIILEIDGVDVSKRATILPEIVSYSLKDVKPGAHMLSLSLQEGSTKILLANWTFAMTQPEKAVAAKEEVETLPIKGDFSVRNSHETISEKTRDITVANGQLSGNLGKLNWAGMVSISSLESKKIQPQNRYTASLKYGKATLKIGDSSPRFSQFTVWGARNRGVEFNYRGYAFNLDVAQGEMMRSVASGIAGIDTTVVLGANGDTLKSVIDPTRDSTVVDSTITYGTFKRSMLAVRPGFPLSDYVTFSLNILKAKDEVSSIKHGLNPKDNLVLGGDLEIRSSNRRFVFQTETALSLYNSNINEPAMQQAEALESMIVVNQYFDPLPTDSAILSDTISQADLAKKVLKELVASSMASQTSLTLNFFKNELKVGYKTVGRSFKSLGSPSIQTDIQGLTVTDRIRLFNNRVYLNLGYESTQDNVNGRQSSDQTLKRNALTGGLSLYTPDYLPNLNFNARQASRENSAKIVHITLPDGTADSTGNPVGDESSSYDISADQEFGLLGFNNNVVVSYSGSNAEDNYNPDAANSMTSTSVQLSSRRGERLETNLSVNLTGQTSMNDQNKIDYTVIGATAQYQLLPKMLWVTGGVNHTIASGGLDPALSDPTQAYAGYALEFARTEFSIGSTFKYGDNHELGLNAYTVNHTDDGYIQSWSAEDANTHLRIYTKIMNKDTPTFVEQNDTSVRLRYSYKF